MIWIISMGSMSFVSVFTGILVLAAQVLLGNAYSLNHTIDDTLPDPDSASKVVYDTSWVSSADCGSRTVTTDEDENQACGLVFDGWCASNRTWHAGLGEGSLSVVFNGSSIYTYFIVPSILLTSHGSSSTQVGSNLSFILDGNLVHEFVQVNYYGTVKYKVPTYRNTSMEMGMHNLTIQNSNTLLDGSQVVRAAAVFDYAIYGVEDGVNPDDDGHDVQTGMLAISIILSAGMLCVVLVLFFFLRLRARHRRTVLKADPWRAPSLVITIANNPDAASEHERSAYTDRLREPASVTARNDEGVGLPQKQVGWPGTLPHADTSSQFPIAEMRRGSASRLESGVNHSTGVNVRRSLVVGVGDVLGRNAVESMDAGFMRRRSTLSRLGIPLETSPVIDGYGVRRSLIPIVESAHSPHQTMPVAVAVPTKRRCTVGQPQAHSRDSLRAEAGSPYEEMQDDRALIMRLESEIRLLRAEREVRLDWARFGFGEGRGEGRDHCDEELPDYDSIM